MGKKSRSKTLNNLHEDENQNHNIINENHSSNRNKQSSGQYYFQQHFPGGIV
jgi:hypothetical protein